MTRNTTDCSAKDDGNPTRLLQEAYSELMALTSWENLRDRMSEILEGSSISRKNLLRFKRDRDRIDESHRDRLAEGQKYVSNYILAGSGLGTKFDK